MSTPSDAASENLGPEPIALEPGKVGIATDIHANPFALREVLRDGAERGVSRWLVLGDVVAMGPAPGLVMDQLADVDVVAFIRGNTERYVLTDDRPEPTFEQASVDSALLPRLVEVAESFAWTRGYLEALGQLDALRSFQPTARLAFPDGTSALAVHASLLADDGRGIAPDVDAEEMAALFPQSDASLVLGGHTHLAADVNYSGVRYINPGSVSNHDAPDHGARYSIVDLRSDRHIIEHRELGYDKTDVIDAIRSCGIPGSPFLLSRYFASSA